MSSSNTVHILFTGLIKDIDEDDIEDELEFGEFDSQIFGLAGDIDRLFAHVTVLF